jgi:hypothetical protein
VTLSGGSGGNNFFVQTVAGEMFLNGGAGNDTVNFGGPSLTLDSVTGHLVFAGKGGADTLIVNDQNTTTPQTFTLDDGSASRSNSTGIAEVDLTTENLIVNAGSGRNTFNITNTPLGLTTTTLNTGLGADTVTVKGTRGPLVVNDQGSADTVNVFPSSATWIQGGITVTNQANFSRLSVSDASTTGRNVTTGIASDGFGFINNLLPTTIRYKFADTIAVVVNAGTGNDNFTITDTLSNSQSPATLIIGNDGNDTFNVRKTKRRLTINGGQGNDTFNIGSAANTLDPIQGPVTVDGEFGTDTLNINDQGSTTKHTYTITSSTIDRNGAARITFASIESLKVNKGPIQGNAPQAKALAIPRSIKLCQLATLSGRPVDADNGQNLSLDCRLGRRLGTRSEPARPSTVRTQAPFRIGRRPHSARDLDRQHRPVKQSRFHALRRPQAHEARAQTRCEGPPRRQTLRAPARRPRRWLEPTLQPLAACRPVIFRARFLSHEGVGLMPAYVMARDGGSDIPLESPVVLIGRHPDCDVRFISPRVSRRHCSLIKLAGEVWVRDLGSSNGIRINDRKVQGGRLKRGDELSIADLRFLLEVQPASRLTSADAPPVRDAPPVVPIPPVAPTAPARLNHSVE